MKKIYILAAMVAFAFSANAQLIEDDFEFYDLGPIGSANEAVWDVWSGTPTGSEDLIITDAFASSGDKAGLIAGGGAQDVILNLGGRVSGTYTLQFQTYIPSGKGGYFNIQGELSPDGGALGGAGVFNSSNIYYNNGGSAAGIFEDATDGSTASYPEDEWFITSIFFDMDGGVPTYVITVNGTQVNPDPVEFQDDAILGGLDIFSIDANNEMYIDEVVFVEGVILGTNDFTASNFSVYPNPVQDRLNISTTNTVDSVVVYDVLGKVVLSATPGVVSPSIDMSALTSGAYLVNITINGSSKTVKVVK